MKGVGEGDRRATTGWGLACSGTPPGHPFRGRAAALRPSRDWLAFAATLQAALAGEVGLKGPGCPLGRCSVGNRVEAVRRACARSWGRQGLVDEGLRVVAPASPYVGWGSASIAAFEATFMNQDERM